MDGDGYASSVRALTVEVLPEPLIPTLTLIHLMTEEASHPAAAQTEGIEAPCTDDLEELSLLVQVVDPK